jgi:hypothetical protein
MRLVKQALAVLGSVVVVATIVTLLAPKTVHAIVATAVEVMNTSANPVPTYDSGTRFQADVCNASGPVSVAAGYCGSTTSKTFVVPSFTSSGATVKRLFVDNVAGFCANFNNPNLFIKVVRLSGQFVPDSVPNGDSAAGHYIPIVGPSLSYTNDPGFGPPLGGVPETDYSFGQTTHFAFNPGDTVTLRFNYFYSTGNFDGVCTATVEGTLATQ